MYKYLLPSVTIFTLFYASISLNYPIFRFFIIFIMPVMFNSIQKFKVVCFHRIFFSFSRKWKLPEYLIFLTNIESILLFKHFQFLKFSDFYQNSLIFIIFSFTFFSQTHSNFIFFFTFLLPNIFAEVLPPLT